MVAELGFEPRQTESESVVLPLHNSASMMLDYYSVYKSFCQQEFSKKLKKFADRQKRRDDPTVCCCPGLVRRATSGRSLAENGGVFFFKAKLPQPVETDPYAPENAQTALNAVQTTKAGGGDVTNE